MTLVRETPATRLGGRKGLSWRGLTFLVVAAAGGGAASALAFPPQRVPGVAIVGAALGLWTMSKARGMRGGAACGFAWGAGFGAVLFRWAAALDPIAYVALVPVQATFWALVGGAVGWLALARDRADGWWALGAVAVWTLGEALRARFPLGGFEWGQLGLTAADLPIRSAAAVVGTLGLTALSVAVAAGLALALVNRESGGRFLLMSVGVLAVVTVFGGLSWTDDAGSMDIAVVQIQDPCPGDFAVDCPGFREVLLERHVEGTRALTSDPDLILWGEGTLRASTTQEAGRRAEEALGGLPAPLLSGVATPGDPGRFHQRNVLYDTDGDVQAVYDKRHPVPFGEYVPFRSVLGRIGDVGRYVPTDIVRGERAVAMPVPVDDRIVELGTVVSWEVTFSRDVRSAARLGDAVVTLTTQSSYGPGQPVSDQLLGAAQLRSAELQKAMAVAATTGRSAIVLPNGELQEPTALFAEDTLEAELPLRSGLTPYARWGDVPVIVLAMAGGVWVLAKRRRTGAPDSDLGE